VAFCIETRQDRRYEMRDVFQTICRRSSVAVFASLMGASWGFATGRPVAFEPNLGQADAAVEFVARCPGYSLLVSAGRLDLVLQDRARTAKRIVWIELAGSRPEARARGADQLPGLSHYYRGRDPRWWIENVPHFGRVEIEQLYPGIDFEVYGAEGEMEFDLVVDQGVDPSRVRIEVQGADTLCLDDLGNLELLVGEERFRLRAPVASQYLGGQRQSVEVDFLVEPNGVVTFDLGPYDTRAPLRIDPVLEYSSFIGGSAFDNGWDIAVAADGSMYVTGSTESTNFPTVLPAQPARGGSGPYLSDVFVCKLSADGQSLLFSTYLGGSEDDEGRSIALASTGPVWVTGMTESTDFPVAPSPCTPAVDCPIQSSAGGGKDAFVARFSFTGALEYASYLGGSADENFILGTGAIAVDSAGSPYIVGETLSSDFPTASPLQGIFGGDRDAFATKLSVSGAAYVYSTFVGGSNLEVAYDVFVDEVGALYGAGRLASDPWIFKVDATGDTLLIDETVSTPFSEWAQGLAVDGAGAIYLVGRTQKTSSSDFPLVNPLQGTYGGGLTDGFVMKLDPTGTTLLYSTFLGGSDQDELETIGLDSAGNIVVAGSTFSDDYPTHAAIQASMAVPGTFSDVVVSVIGANGTALLFSTPIGGGQGEEARSLSIDDSNRIFFTGYTQSSDFPTEAAYDDSWNSGSDVFVMVLEGPLIFADGFESGGLTRWSSSVP